MDEVAWLACRDPEPMLDFLRGKVSERKLRLFAVACCRNIGHLLEDDMSGEALCLAERFADGLASNAERREVQRLTNGLAVFVLYADVSLVVDVVRRRVAITVSRPHESTFPEGATHHEWASNYEIQNPAQSALIRDIFGNPFRPVAFAPAWRTSTAVALAAQMYESREFSAMPILADALQDAGCDSDDVLNHCRSDGPHVRGCWVVDLVLGKV